MNDLSPAASTWRERLAHAVEANQNYTMRSASVAAKLAPGYLHSILKAGKEPTVANLFRVCDVLGVSATFILSGIQMSPETERIVRLLERDPGGLAAIDELLKRR